MESPTQWHDNTSQWQENWQSASVVKFPSWTINATEEPGLDHHEASGYC